MKTTDITLLPTDSFIVTGRKVCGRRFRIVTSDPRRAFGINLWDGNIWLQRDGKRTLLQRVVMSNRTIIRRITAISNTAL